MSGESNGAYKAVTLGIERLTDKQESIETVLISGFNELKDTMNHGHNAIAEEIRKVREVGSLPIPLVEKMIDHFNNTNQKNSDKVYKIVIVLLVAMIGLKTFLPDLLK